MKNDISSNLTSKPQSGKLGTFAGVLTPSVLTILGIILFLRLGYVVGNAGLGRALIMIGLANTISVLTSISLAAISTNLKVKGGRGLLPDLANPWGRVRRGHRRCPVPGTIRFHRLLLHGFRRSYDRNSSRFSVVVHTDDCRGGRPSSFHIGMAGCGLGHPVSIRGHALDRPCTGFLFLGWVFPVGGCCSFPQLDNRLFRHSSSGSCLPSFSLRLLDLHKG